MNAFSNLCDFRSFSRERARCRMLIKIFARNFSTRDLKSKFSMGSISQRAHLVSHFRVTDLFDHFFPPFFFNSRHYNSRLGIDTPRCSSIGKSGKEQWRWPVIVDLIEIGCNNCVVDRSFRHPLLNQNWRVHPRSMQINLTVLRTNISQNWWRKIIWRSEAY